MYISKYKDSFIQLNTWSEKFQKPHKGLFLAGHIRFHKIELLNYLYENNLLDENFIWSSTDETFQSACLENLFQKEMRQNIELSKY